MLIRQHFIAGGLILSIAVVGLSVPFILEENGTSLVWLLEGAILLWVGLWQQSVLLRTAGLLLQGYGAYLFLDAVFYPLYSIVFVNLYFYSCLFIGGCGLFSEYLLEREVESLYPLERWLLPVLLVWGQLWVYSAGLREIAGHLIQLESYNSFLLYSCAVSIALTIVARKLSWVGLGVTQLLFLPVAVGCGVVGWLSLPGSSHLFAGKGWVAWLVAVFCQFRMLHHYEGIWPAKFIGCYYVVTIWLVTVLVCHELKWIIVAVLGYPASWGYAIWLLLPIVVVCTLIRRWRCER